MHGVRKEMLYAQADAMGLPLQELLLPATITMSEYDSIITEKLHELKSRHKVTHSAFGDIYLEDLKKYREKKLAEINMQALFPLWKRDTTELLNEFLDLGFKTILVCIKGDVLDESFVGRVIDKEFIKELPDGVDPCGENGEFHTFVFDGPIFKRPVPFTLGETVFRTYEAPKDKDDSCLPADKEVPNNGYFFKDLILAESVV